MNEKSGNCGCTGAVGIVCGIETLCICGCTRGLFGTLVGSTLVGNEKSGTCGCTGTVGIGCGTETLCICGCTCGFSGTLVGCINDTSVGKDIPGTCGACGAESVLFFLSCMN